MQLTVADVADVAEVRHLLDSGAFYRLYHPFLRYLKLPEDVGGRWRQIRTLLWQQPEFETRYPAAWKALFSEKAKKKETLGLPLPSFGIRVMRHSLKISLPTREN